MKRYRKFLVLLLACAGILALSGCKLAKYANVGLDVDYYGGEFHVRPNASVGVTGYK